MVLCVLWTCQHWDSNLRIHERIYVGEKCKCTVDSVKLNLKKSLDRNYVNWNTGHLFFSSAQFLKCIYIYLDIYLCMYIKRERRSESRSPGCLVHQKTAASNKVLTPFFQDSFVVWTSLLEIFTNCRNSKVWHWLFIMFMIKSDFKSNDAAVLKQHCASFLSSFLTSFLPSFKASILPSIFPSFHPRLPSFLSLCGTSCRLYPNTDPLFRAGRALRLTTPWAFNGRRVFFPN